MDVGEIKDKKSLEAWLNSLPQGIEAERGESRRWGVLIAHRSAMRVLPMYWQWTLRETPHKTVLTAPPVLWPSVIAGVVGKRPNPAIAVSARSATLSARSAYRAASAAGMVVRSAARSASAAGSAARSTAGSASYAAYAAYAASAAGSALSAASTARGSFSAALNALRTDCAALVSGRDPNRLPLWSDSNPVGDLWSEIRTKILAQSPGWHFWVDWYDKALNGEPQDWPLLTKIALIDPADWERGADHVNSLITKIRLDHIAETRPLGEDAIDKGADGLWHRVGHSDIDRDILQDACDRVADTVKRIRAAMKKSQNNALTALTDDLKTLTTDLRRYRDRPLRLHDTFLKVQRHIARDLASGELPDDHLVDDLRTDLGTAALDMRNACPKTAQVVAARASARFATLDERERTAIVQIAEAAASLSDAPLAAEFREDVAEAVSVEVPPQDKAPAQYRLTTRLAKMASEAGDNILAALIKIGEVGDGLSTISDLAILLLRFIL